MWIPPPRAALALGALLVWAGCASPGPSPVAREAGAPAVTVHVVGHGWHTGIVFDRDAIPPGSWPEHARFPAARFLEVGWGDRTFYETPDAGVGLALRAAFASRGSALHLTGFDRPPAAPVTAVEVVAIELAPHGLAALARFVADTYARDGVGNPVDLGPGLTARSRFYAAGRTYSLSYTCNTWVAEALHAAGCPASPPWPVTASGLLRLARRCAQPLAVSPSTPGRPGYLVSIR